MFIATHVSRFAKLRRSGMCWCSLGRSCRSIECQSPVHAAPTELGRVCGLVVTINMALLAELGGSPRPNMGLWSRTDVGDYMIA